MFVFGAVFDFLHQQGAAQAGVDDAAPQVAGGPQRLGHRVVFRAEFQLQVAAGLLLETHRLAAGDQGEVRQLLPHEGGEDAAVGQPVDEIFIAIDARLRQPPVLHFRGVGGEADDHGQ